MDPVQTLVFAAALPAVVAVVVIFLRRFTRAGDDAGLAVVAGFLAGYAGLGGRWRLPPTEASHALPLVAAAAGLALAVGVTRALVPSFVRRAVLVALAAGAVAYTVIDRTIPWLGGTFLGIVAFAIASERRAASTGPKAALLGTLITTGGTAVALGLSGTATVATFAGALAAAIGGVLAMSWRVAVSVRGVALATGVLLPMLWLGGWIFADLPLASMALLALSPIAADFARGLGAKRGERTAFVAETAASLVLAGAAAGIALQNSPPLDY